MELHRMGVVSTLARSNYRKIFLKMQAVSESSVSTLGKGSMRSSAQSPPSAAQMRGDAGRGPASQCLHHVSVLASNSDVESLVHFSNHLPYRVPPPSRWTRRTLIRMLTGLLC